MAQVHQSGERDSPNQTEDDRQYAESTDVFNITIPLIREEVDVRKEPVDEATVRITKVVEEKPAFVDELLASEQIEVERFPVGRIVAAPPSIRMEGDVMIIPVVEEVLVVTKQFRLKEELRVTTKRLQTEYHQEVMLRSEDVIVERFTKSKTD